MPRAKVLHNSVRALCFFFDAVIYTSLGCSASLPCLAGWSAFLPRFFHVRSVGVGLGSSHVRSRCKCTFIADSQRQKGRIWVDWDDCLYSLLNPQYGKWQPCSRKERVSANYILKVTCGQKKNKKLNKWKCFNPWDKPSLEAAQLDGAAAWRLHARTEHGDWKGKLWENACRRGRCCCSTPDRCFPFFFRLPWDGKDPVFFF